MVCHHEQGGRPSRTGTDLAPEAASACQEVMAEIVKKLRMVKVTLHWIPGHAGSEGNEEADKLAKAATRKESEEPPPRDGVPWYLVRLAMEKADIAGGFSSHKTAETGRFTRKIDAAFHLGNIPEMAGGVGGPLMRKEADFMIFDGLLILLAVVLQSAVHPGIFAGAMQDCTTHLYKLKAPLVVNDRSESHELDQA
ncbi:hypothetical protein DM02DRAFT_664443 [Periconia macrospinosa]|uniref:RNase H type-1 domain-containing protein n=1 Tax=Periconia macrospinosa TaxID=97972 RepID=A0A2V1CZ24_9PLEO|nr:hypothetical protein DM02DRAFT_664443 [Periconia macrospinosa]